MPRLHCARTPHDADLLVLAGDICNGTEAVKLVAHWRPVPVLYVAGNHEYCSYEMKSLRTQLRAAAHGTSVPFLDNDVANFGGVRFLGTTLWTDYQLTLNRRQSELMNIAERRISDHRCIRLRGGTFIARDALAEHEASRTWLRACAGQDL